ncbi:MAG: hypothetical protein ACI4BD_05885 [Paludibacteraceae bacterium]
MKRFFLALMGLIMAVAFNTVAGATIATVVGAAPIAGAVVTNGVGILSGLFSNSMPKLRVGVYAEVWTGELIKAFRTAAESIGWYNRIRSYDSYVKNDVIHLVDVGADPTVLVNNNTYPLEVEDLPDGDKAVKLDKFQSKPTRVTDDELHAISYDKMQSVIDRHKEAFFEVKYARAIHSLAPAGNTEKTPIILTTGAATDGRKSMTRADIIALKKKFDKAGIAKDGRILVLCGDHVADLLETDQKFADQYYNYQSGKISNLYGFEVYEYEKCPYYNATTLEKIAYGAIPSSSTDMQASIAFSLHRAMRADGSTKTYLSEAAQDPKNQANLFSMRTYTLCLPTKAEGQGAIVSAKA